MLMGEGSPGSPQGHLLVFGVRYLVQQNLGTALKVFWLISCYQNIFQVLSTAECDSENPQFEFSALLPGVILGLMYKNEKTPSKTTKKVLERHHQRQIFKKNEKSNMGIINTANYPMFG